MGQLNNLISNISWLGKLGYGIGNFGYGIAFQIVSSYLVFYSTAVLEVPGSLVGMAVSISVIWDGITDPLMGYISDNTRSKTFGRRHLYILIGTFGIVIFNYGLWIIDPDFNNILKFLWILVDLLIIKTFTTIYATPYTALGGELSKDYNERTSIQGVKMIFFLLGLFIATVMGMLLFFRPTAEYPVGQLNPVAYKNIGITSSVVMLISGLTCYFATKKYIPYLPKAIGETYSDKNGIFNMLSNVSEAFKNKPYRHVVIGYLFTNIASAMVSTLGLHVFTYTFNMDNNGIAVIVGTQFIMSIISQPFWVLISRRIDKKYSVIAGLMLGILGSGLLLILVFLKDMVNGNFLYLIIPSALVGFGTGGLFSLPLSMIADTIDVDELNTGVRSEGIYYGAQTLCYKLSQSLAIFMLGVVLDLVKFDSGLSVQPEKTVMILGVILAGGCIIAFVMSMLSYINYDLDKNKIDDIQREISKRNTTKIKPISANNYV